MPAEKSAVPSGLKPCQLTDGQLTAIGRLIRACAEIEEFLDYFIADAAQLGDGQFTLLLGKSGWSSKIALGLQLAKKSDVQELDDFKRNFCSPEVADVMRVRNCVAHGILLGSSDSDDLVFRMRRFVGSTEEWNVVDVHAEAIKPDGLKYFALSAEQIVHELLRVNKLSERHQRTRSGTLKASKT